MTKNWYVLRVASNREDQVRDALERKVKIENLGDLIGRILVPTERIKRVKQGQQKVAERKLYPGYVFVEMEVNNDGTIPGTLVLPSSRTRRASAISSASDATSRIRCATDEVAKTLQDVEKSEAHGRPGPGEGGIQEGRPDQDQGRAVRELRRDGRRDLPGQGRGPRDRDDLRAFDPAGTGILAT